MIARIASFSGLRERWTPDGRHIVEDADGRVVVDEPGVCPVVPFEWWREPKETWLRFGPSPPKLRGLAALGLGLVSRE